MECVSDQIFNTLPDQAFQGTTYEDCTFNGIDFTNCILTSSSFLDCTFTTCKLANQSLVNASFRNVTFESCDLMGLNWCQLKRADDLRFNASRLNFNVFQELKLKGISITDCSAHDADFSGTDLTNADLSGTDFTGATFNQTLLTGANFRGSTGYVFDLRTTNIKGTRFSLPEAGTLITALGGQIEV